MVRGLSLIPRNQRLTFGHLRLAQTEQTFTDTWPRKCLHTCLSLVKVNLYVLCISCFVDSNHTGNVVTQRLHSTGILIYYQNAQVIWYSKRQSMVELLSFGSKFIALRIAKEMIVALWYKLRIWCPSTWTT
jgi:hypothetical protein